MGPRTKPQLHYEAAFEDYLRREGIPCIAVDEAKRALFGAAKLKNFDFVVYRPGGENFLVDVKGRACDPKKGDSLQNWVTRLDIDDLREWEDIFGHGFKALFLFMYHWRGRPESAPFKDLFLFNNRWYSPLAISLSDYREHMNTRSEQWGTVHIPAEKFRQLAKPFDELY